MSGPKIYLTASTNSIGDNVARVPNVDYNLLHCAPNTVYPGSTSQQGFSLKPLGDLEEEVQQVMQTGGVSSRQQT